MVRNNKSQRGGDWKDIDLTQAKEAERVMLPHIKPLGLRTGQVESLTGYVTRLALATTSSPIQLVHNLIGWFVFGGPMRLGLPCAKARDLTIRNTALLPNLGTRFSRAVERLTGVVHLGCLNVAALTKVFSLINMVRAHRAWCPECLHRDKKPYDRLIWTLNAVTHCPEHFVPLLERCHSCRRLQPHLTHNGSAKHCFSCASPLDKMPRVVPAKADSFDVWSAQTIAGLIASSQSDGFAATAESLRNGIRLGFESPVIERPRKLAKLLGVSHITAWGWVNNGIGVRLEMAVRIARLYNVELRDLALGSVRSKRILPLRMSPWSTDRCFRKIARAIPANEAINSIRKLRTIAPLTRLTKAAVASDLRVSYWNPVFDDPEVSNVLDRAQRRARLIKSTLQVWETCNAIRGAVCDLVSADRRVTQRSVREQLPVWGVKPGVTRTRYARKLLERISRALEEGNSSALDQRPPPRIIRPIIELRE